MSAIINKKPTIICTGILNTKGDEIKYLAEQAQKLGADTIIMELSLGAEVGWADVSLTEVLKEDNLEKEEVFKASRADAIDLVGKAGAKKIMKMYEEGKVDGIIAWAGSVGTTVSTMVMRALPIGIPKIMMSTCAAGDVSGWLGSSDIMILNPISEKGINVVTQRIATNAVSAVVSMGSLGEIKTHETKPLMAITAYGTTTPSVMRCQDYFTEKGWDSIIIHQVGTGATMEDLIKSGFITAIIDLTTGEITNTMYESIFGINKEWKGERLTAASEMGIPQIVCPGGLAQCAYGPLSSVPEKFLKDYRSGKRMSYKDSKKPYIHNPAITVITPTLEETEEVADYMISRLNKTTGPTALIVPMRGWSAYDQSAELATVERGWAKENGDGPVWMPDPDKPEWSKRATVMWSVFEKEVNKSNENIDIIKCDMHILDTEFTDLLNKCMQDMIDKKWKKGMYRDVGKVVE